MAIRQWTQPDGDHFRGLCANEFWPVADANGSAGGCNICVTPVQLPIPRCGCTGRTPIGIPFYKTYYLRLAANVTTYPGIMGNCWAALLPGDFTLNWVGGVYQCAELTIGLAAVPGNTCIPAGGTAAVHPDNPIEAVPRYSRFTSSLQCQNTQTNVGTMNIRFTWFQPQTTPPNRPVWTLSVDRQNPTLTAPWEVLFQSTAEICTDKRSKFPVFYRYNDFSPSGFVIPRSVQVGELSTHPIT